MKILLLSAYDALSHRYWRQGLVEQFPDIEWTVLTLPARYFRYRVRSNPLSWLADEQQTLEAKYDAVIATSMVDVATLRGLVPSLAVMPLWLYCHENQFAYPAGAEKNNPIAHDLEAKMVFIYNCLAADKISFNSHWNRDSALAGMAELLHRFPEKINPCLLESITNKSDVLPVPLTEKLNLSPSVLDTDINTNVDVDVKVKVKVSKETSPLRLLWNHRWEYDKGPDRLLAFVNALETSGLICELNIVGQQFRQIPKAFSHIEKVLEQSSTLQKGSWGYIESASDYQQLLQQCDVVVSTALHDYQGIAVLEAVQAGCVPLLPNHIVYPEIFSDQYLYPVAIDQGLIDERITAHNMLQLLERWQQGLPLLPNISRFEWHKQRDYYQKGIQSLYKH
jgi:glycosyltransferase involved in cell wall biosynthesis